MKNYPPLYTHRIKTSQLLRQRTIGSWKIRNVLRGIGSWTCFKFIEKRKKRLLAFCNLTRDKKAYVKQRIRRATALGANLREMHRELPKPRKTLGSRSYRKWLRKIWWAIKLGWFNIFPFYRIVFTHAAYDEHFTILPTLFQTNLICWRNWIGPKECTCSYEDG